MKKRDLFLSVVFNYIETLFYYNYNGLKLVVHSEIMQADKAVRALYSQLLVGAYFIIYHNPLSEVYLSATGNIGLSLSCLWDPHII